MNSNLPLSSSVEDPTVQAFGAYYTEPIELSSTAYDAAVGFFTSRGFQEVAAESISTILLTQAKNDGYNPVKILDTLRGLSSVELSGLVAELLNYNRVKTSSLGVSQPFTPNPEIQRNIMA